MFWDGSFEYPQHMFWLKNSLAICFNLYKYNSRNFQVLQPTTDSLTHYLLVSSADNFCKQIGPRSGSTKHWAWSGSKLFDTDGIPDLGPICLQRLWVGKEFSEAIFIENQSKKNQFIKICSIPIELKAYLDWILCLILQDYCTGPHSAVVDMCLAADTCLTADPGVR